MCRTHDLPRSNDPTRMDANVLQERTEVGKTSSSNSKGMRPRLGVETDGLWTVIEFVDVEELYDENIVRDIGDQLVDLIESGHDRIVIDLGAIRYMSSYMLGQLIRIQRKIDQTQGALRLRKLDPRVHDLFKICRLEQLFTIFDRDVDSTARLNQET